MAPTSDDAPADKEPGTDATTSSTSTGTVDPRSKTARILDTLAEKATPDNLSVEVTTVAGEKETLVFASLEEKRRMYDLLKGPGDEAPFESPDIA